MFGRFADGIGPELAQNSAANGNCDAKVKDAHHQRAFSLRNLPVTSTFAIWGRFRRDARIT